MTRRPFEDMRHDPTAPLPPPTPGELEDRRFIAERIAPIIPPPAPNTTPELTAEEAARRDLIEAEDAAAARAGLSDIEPLGSEPASAVEDRTTADLQADNEVVSERITEAAKENAEDARKLADEASDEDLAAAESNANRLGAEAEEAAALAALVEAGEPLTKKQRSRLDYLGRHHDPLAWQHYLRPGVWLTAFERWRHNKKHPEETYTMREAYRHYRLGALALDASIVASIPLVLLGLAALRTAAGFKHIQIFDFSLFGADNDPTISAIPEHTADTSVTDGGATPPSVEQPPQQQAGEFIHSPEASATTDGETFYNELSELNVTPEHLEAAMQATGPDLHAMGVTYWFAGIDANSGNYVEEWRLNDVGAIPKEALDFVSRFCASQGWLTKGGPV